MDISELWNGSRDRRPAYRSEVPEGIWWCGEPGCLVKHSNAMRACRCYARANNLDSNVLYTLSKLKGYI